MCLLNLCLAPYPCPDVSSIACYLTSIFHLPLGGAFNSQSTGCQRVKRPQKRFYTVAARGPLRNVSDFITRLCSRASTQLCARAPLLSRQIRTAQAFSWVRAAIGRTLERSGWSRWERARAKTGDCRLRGSALRESHSGWRCLAGGRDRRTEPRRSLRRTRSCTKRTWAVRWVWDEARRTYGSG